MNHSHYKHNLMMFPVHVAIMYVVMFAMIDTGADFFNNINMLYMAILMAAPMELLMVLSMKSMYTDAKKKAPLVGGLLLLAVLAFVGIRQQTAVGDQQFIRSMIPHHSGAILMCREAALQDAELVALCKTIEAAQRREIDQMNAIKARLDARD